MMSTTITPIQVYAVNLAQRTDRKEHIISQFRGREEFELNIVPAIEHKIGAYGLWQTLRQIVKLELDKGSEYFVLCEDDHTFTDNYKPELLQQCLQIAQQLNADILSGGVSWFNCGVLIHKNLYWIDKFNGLQFTVFFNKFYSAFMDADFGEHPIVDINIANITENKFVIYPYISVQKEFGYSDVTSKNAEKGYVDGIFKSSTDRLDILNKVKLHYFK